MLLLAGKSPGIVGGFTQNRLGHKHPLRVRLFSCECSLEYQLVSSVDHCVSVLFLVVMGLLQYSGRVGKYLSIFVINGPDGSRDRVAQSNA